MKKKVYPICTECSTNKHVIKFGKSRGKQKYHCKLEGCKRTFTSDDEYKSSGAGKWYSALDQIKACDRFREMNKEGVSLRKAAKALGISHTSLARWDNEYEWIRCCLSAKEEEEYKNFKASKKE